MDLKNIIKQAIDIHVHIGPEIIPRKYTVNTLIDEDAGKLGGAVLKNHFYPTSPLIASAKKSGLKLFGGIVLNNAVGGLNSEAIYSVNLISEKPIVVWFPTTNAENFLKQSVYEIAPEWVEKKGFKARSVKKVKPVLVTKDAKLTNETIDVLKMIKQCNASLATGHISWQESVLLIERALKLEITKIVVTHPIYQRINMPVKIQKMLAKKGVFIEQSYSMYSIDKISIKNIASQIKAVGMKYVILSSDVGQTFSPSPSIALTRFSTLLKREGITNQELFEMLVVNPKKLLGIE